MTETTALLRAIHCDLAAVCGFLAALAYEKGATDSPYAGNISEALAEAGRHYRLADKLSKEAE